MEYCFVVNGRQDMAFILEKLRSQFDALGIAPRVYVTKGTGDATRFVRLYCEFHPEVKTCFVSCGGTGTANEVASGLVGSKGNTFAVMAFGNTDDFTKCFPGRNFRSVADILDGETVPLDVIRCNNDYAINMINIGFDAAVSYEANRLVERGIRHNSYGKAIFGAIFLHRFNNLRIVVDGERISRFTTLLCTVANGRYCGGEYLSAPNAKLDDGLMDVCLMRGMSLASFLHILPKYKAGKHLEDRFSLRRLVYRQARRVEVSSRTIQYISLDGETVASTHFVIEILPKAITIQLPVKK